MASSPLAHTVAQLTALAALLVVFPNYASATTWQVDQTGGGDFTVIQDAVDASCPGDTILVGPGRYTDVAPFQYDTNTVGDTYAFRQTTSRLFLNGYSTLPETIYVDLTDNYWGTTDPDSLGNFFWDGNDDPEVNGFVLYEPARRTPLPTRSIGFGELKSRFHRE